MLESPGFEFHQHSANPPYFPDRGPSRSASWLNLVERWFVLITSQAIRRGSFDSVRSLERAINRYLANWNETAKPFRWTKSARQNTRWIRRVKDIYENGH